MFELIRTFNGIDFDVRFENKVNLFLKFEFYSKVI